MNKPTSEDIRANHHVNAKEDGLSEPPRGLDWSGLYFPDYWVKKHGVLESIEQAEAEIDDAPTSALTVWSRLSLSLGSLLKLGGGNRVPGPRFVEAWGWGDTESDANAVAEYRLVRAIDRAKADETDWDKYGYGLGDMPLQETLLETISKDEDGQITAAITRNRYGSLILSTRDLMMIDIDLPTESPDEHRQTNMSELIEQTKERLAEEVGKSFLLYETAGGLRAICTSHKFIATDEYTLNLMERVSADRLYITLCKSQKCFRARLSPKPWRLEPSMEPEGDEPSDEWIEEYNLSSKTVSVCRLIGKIGPETIDPAFFEALHAHNSAVSEDPQHLA